MESQPLNTLERSNYQIGDLELDIYKRWAIRGNRIITLSPNEYLLLRFLFFYKNKMLSKTQILKEVWGKPSKSSAILRVCIYNLREKIDRDYQNKLIHTHYKVGYILRES